MVATSRQPSILTRNNLDILEFGQSKYRNIVHAKAAAQNEPNQLPIINSIKPLDHLKRGNFSDWALLKFEKILNFVRKIIMGHEAHF